jgi:hypothetical protein
MDGGHLHHQSERDRRGIFILDDLSAGNHQVDLDINTVPGPGTTYYLNETRNHGGTIGIYFACPS